MTWAAESFDPLTNARAAAARMANAKVEWTSARYYAGRADRTFKHYIEDRRRSAQHRRRAQALERLAMELAQ